MKRLILYAALAAAAAAQAADRAHEHGIARLDVAVERQRITLQLQTPLDNLVGFERAPRNAAERRALDAALARLADPAALWRIDAAGGCGAGKADVQPPNFAGGHADVSASWVYDCQDATRAAAIDAELFAAFARLQRLQVQLALEKGQRGLTLRRPASRIPLQR